MYANVEQVKIEVKATEQYVQVDVGICIRADKTFFFKGTIRQISV